MYEEQRSSEAEYFDEEELESADGSEREGPGDYGTGDYIEGLEEFGMYDLDLPEDQGDHTDSYEEYYIDPQECRVPSLYSTEGSKQGPGSWPDDDLLWEEDAESDLESYVSISKLLIDEGEHRNEWYDSPNDEEFRAAFACLNSRRNLAKKYLLEMLNPCQDEDALCSLGDLEPRIAQQVSFALSDLRIPRLARLSVEKLSDLLIEYPTLDLRKFLIGLDVFTIAYVIWGIDFYMNRKCFDIGVEEGTTVLDGGSINEDDTSKVGDSLREKWSSSLHWISNTFSSFISNGGQSL